MAVEGETRFLRILTLLATIVFAATTISTSEAWAGARRAFVVGESYGDKENKDTYTGLPSLARTVNDATDLAKDLEEAGFPHENIKLATSFRSKADFVDFRRELTQDFH